MDESLIIAFATLGGSFIGIIFGALFNQWLKVRRKRLDYLFNEVDKLHNLLATLHSDLTKERLESDHDYRSHNEIPKATYLKQKDVYAISLSIKINAYVIALKTKPEIIHYKKVDGTVVPYIKRRDMFGSKKRAKVAKSLSAIFSLKFIAPPFVGRGMNSLYDYETELLARSLEFYSSFKECSELL